MKNKIIIFPPDPCLHDMSIPTLIVSDNLRNLDFNVEFFYNTQGTYLHNSFGGASTASKVNLINCKKCKKNILNIKKYFNFKSHFLHDYLTKNDIKKIKRINNYLVNKKPSFLYNFKFDGIPVGRFGYYMPSLIFKKLNINSLTEKEKIIYLKDINECLQYILSFKNFIKGRNKIKSILVYNALYGKNRCLSYLAKKKKLKLFQYTQVIIIFYYLSLCLYQIKIRYLN